MDRLKNKWLYVILLIAFLTGCKKNLTELNINPDQPLSTDPNYLFSYALQQGMGNYNSDVNLEQWALMNWTMFMAARGGVEPGKEYEIPGGKDDFWREQYTNALSNTQLIIDMAEDDPSMQNMKAAALIWKVYLFQRLADLWGPIPYSQALQGMTELNFSPAYDRQETIYRDFIVKLQQAVNSFDPSKKFFNANSDLIYHRDMDRWKAFGNSLLLRIATRMNKVDFETYTEVVNGLKNQTLISDNPGSAIFPFNSVAKNHLWETMYRGESTIQNNPSKFFVDLLTQRNDPRINVFFKKGSLASLPFIPDYNGVPNLLPNNDPAWENYNLNDDLGVEGEWGDISKIGDWFLNNNTPGVVLSYSETCLLLAEACLNGAWEGDAGEWLKKGVRAHMEFMNEYLDPDKQITQQEMDDYLGSMPEATLEEIITQKWISYAFENGYEAWAEYRRTGFPVLTDYYGNPIDPSTFPKRMIYPNTEYTLNRYNYNQAVLWLGGDTQFERVWWDEN